MLQPNEFTYVHNGHEGKMFHQCLARDVNHQGIFLMFGGMVAITAVVTANTTVPSVRPAGIVIFGRGFWSCSTLSSPLFFKHLKKEKKKI
jgi:hypothetical protein